MVRLAKLPGVRQPSEKRWLATKLVHPLVDSLSETVAGAYVLRFR